jgi:hypothetical protein
MSNKIPMTRINFLFSESPVLANQSFTRWSDATNAVLAVSTKMTSMLGAYKTDFTITFTDGFVYEGRLDVTPEVYDLAQHIHDFCTFHTGTKKPGHLSSEQYQGYLQSLRAMHSNLTEEYQHILDTYLFEDIFIPTHQIAI